MPDHMHMLVQAESVNSDFARFVRIAKQRTAFNFRRTRGSKLWNPSYWDRTLRGGNSTVSVVRYIVLNPVKAGLVSDPLEYPHWGSEIYTRGELLQLISTGGSPDL